MHAPIQALLFPTQWGKCSNRLVTEHLVWPRQLSGMHFPQVFAIATTSLFTLKSCLKTYLFKLAFNV